jgi:hypothetical protein
MTPRAVKVIPLREFVLKVLPTAQPPNPYVTREEIADRIVATIEQHQAIAPRMAAIHKHPRRLTAAVDMLVAAVREEKLQQALAELADLARGFAVGRQLYLSARRVSDELQRVREWRRTYSPRKGPSPAPVELADAIEDVMRRKKEADGKPDVPGAGYHKYQVVQFLQRLGKYPSLPRLNLETTKKRPRAKPYRAVPPL